MVNRFFYPFLGGVEVHVQNLGIELAKLGCTVTVACLDSSNRPGREVFRGLEIRRLRGLHQLPGLMRERFEIVHAHMPRTALTFGALYLANQRGLPTVLTPHCFYPSRRWPSKALKWLYDSVVMPQTLKFADRVINLTENDRRDSLRRGLAPEKSRIIPNSIRVSELASVDAVDFRRKYALPWDFVLHVGRFDPVKNIEFLVRAQLKLQDIGLVLIGQDGGRLDAVRHVVQELHLEERVRIIGRASFQDLCGAYRQARVVALASQYEGLPTVLLEALYFGRPIVASRVGGVPYVLKDESIGLCYAFDQESEYLACVRRALTRDHAVASLVRSLVERQYSWEVNAARVLDLYLELRAEHARKSVAA